MKESTIRLRPAGVRVQVTFNGEVIADTRDAVRMDEGPYPPVYYVPRKDVKMERLIRTSHTTHCPFKGDATYYSVSNGRTAKNAAWSYERPCDAMAGIRELLAFYADRVDSISVSP